MKFQKFKWFIRYQPQPMPNTMKFQKFLRGLCSSWTLCSWELGLAASKWTRLSGCLLPSWTTAHRHVAHHLLSRVVASNRTRLSFNSKALRNSSNSPMGWGWLCDSARFWGRKKKCTSKHEGKQIPKPVTAKTTPFRGIFFSTKLAQLGPDSRVCTSSLRVHRVWSKTSLLPSWLVGLK